MFIGYVYALVGVAVTLLIGGLFAGRQSKKRGKGFWNGFANYLNENWAQTLAEEMIMYLVSFGVTQALGLWTKCFIGGTLVLTSIGLIKIEDIKVGDEVLSYNEETNKKELKKVKRIFRNKTNEWLHLTIKTKDKEEEIVCTKNHRIYINNKGWIEAKDILENDEVLLYNNVKGEVIKKELQILDHYETTYNFEVEDNHNYYVSDSCVLVHNDCGVEANKHNDCGVEANKINTGNAKNNKFAENYDEAMDIAKEVGGVSGDPYLTIKNNYGGYDLKYLRRTKKGSVEVVIKCHLTGHPNRNMTRHINVNNGLDNKKWHIFF